MSSKFYKEREDAFGFYPELSEYPEFTKANWANSDENAKYVMYHAELSRYVVFLYDPASPLLQEKDIEQARKTAAKQAFKHLPSFIEELISGEISLISDMAIRFLKMVNNYKLTVLVGNRELLYKLTKRMMAPLALEFGDDKEARYFTTMMKASQETRQLIATIQELEVELFGADNKLITHYAASDALESTIQQTAVERFAK